MHNAWIPAIAIWSLIFIVAIGMWLHGKYKVSRLETGCFYSAEPGNPFVGEAALYLVEMKAGWCKYRFWFLEHGLTRGEHSMKASSFASIYTRIPDPPGWNEP